MTRPFGWKRGFTLIELMIVVAVIGTLAAIAIPKFSDLLRKSKEGSTKGNLGRIRSALSIYYGDMEGNYPVCVWGSNSSVLSTVLVPKYINTIPLAYAPNFHMAGAGVFCHQDNDFAHDGTGWGYDGEYLIYGPYNNRGDMWVFCTHTDTKSTRWDKY